MEIPGYNPLKRSRVNDLMKIVRLFIYEGKCHSEA